MPHPLKILIAEDNALDAELLVRALRGSDFDVTWTRVDTEKAFRQKVGQGFDLVLSDYNMPQFSGIRALEILRELSEETPFILVSGTIGEDTAVHAIKLGATDYIMKDRLATLGAAARRALAESRAKRERRQAQEALVLFRTLVDQSNDTFQVIDPETGSFIDVTGTGPAALGYSREEYLSMRIFDLDPAITPSAWHDSVCERRDPDVLNGRRMHRRKDGTLVPVECRAKLVRLDRDYMVTVCRDITFREQAESSLRESEEKFRQLAENIHEVFWLSEAATGKLLYVSPGYEKIWGRSSEALYRGEEAWHGSILPEDRERVIRAAETKQADGDYDETYRISVPNGTVRWIRDRAYPIRDATGVVRRIAGTAEDITDYRKLEEQFRQAHKMEAIGTLAGGIAHDFNNILTAIIGYTEFAKMEAGDNQQVLENLELVLFGARRASELVRQILAFSRQQEQVRSPIQLNHVLRETMGLLRATIPATIEFDVVLSEGTPAVLADPTQVHQVLMNIGTNAGHAMSGKAGRLEVRLEPVELTEESVATRPDLKPGAYARLSVADTGCGMDPATMERIFDPFFTTKKPGQGTGLGLAAVHGIMHAHEGAVYVESEPGTGTRFDLFFPAYPGEASPESEPVPTSAPRGSGERILYVDDEPPLARLGKRILERLGYRVEAHVRPREAIDSLCADPGSFDLVVTDQIMPELTGLDLAGLVRKVRPDIPIILTTGYAAMLQSDPTQEIGVDRLILKPITIDSLATVIHAVLAAREAGTRKP
jgi:PAS domain S-box-containing protein